MADRVNTRAIFAAAAFVACIPAANWLIGNVGTTCVPQGPCLIPVAPGLMAPSGVLMIGLALLLRDAVHEAGGWRLSVLCIMSGAALSLIVSPPSLAIASAVAFAVAELADLAVYAPLRRRHLPAAVAASGVVGAVVDSCIFVWLAFGSLDLSLGTALAKIYASALVAGILWTRGRRFA